MLFLRPDLVHSISEREKSILRQQAGEGQGNSVRVFVESPCLVKNKMRVSTSP